jgi:hypothetical protein
MEQHGEISNGKHCRVGKLLEVAEGGCFFISNWVATSSNMDVKSGLSGGSFLRKNKQKLMAKRARRYLPRSVQRGTYPPVLTSNRSVTTGMWSPYFVTYFANLFFTWFSCKMLNDGIILCKLRTLDPIVQEWKNYDWQVHYHHIIWSGHKNMSA